jgi:signal transduction histidine kinase
MSRRVSLSILTFEAKSGNFAWLLLSISLLCCPVRWASANCISDFPGANDPYTELIQNDPRTALSSIEAALAQFSPQAVSLPSRAQLYASLVDANLQIGDIVAASKAARLGEDSLTATDSATLRRRLQLIGIELLDEQGQLKRAAVEFDAAAATVPENAPEFPCVMYTRGYQRFRIGREVDATTDLMQAYRVARDRGLDDLRLQAGLLLASLYSRFGLHEEALSLVNEAIDFYSRSDNKSLLSNAYFYRGDVYLVEENYAAADADFSKSREILGAEASPTDLFYIVQRLCMGAAQTPERADAGAVCQEAYDRAAAVKDPEGVKTALAEIAQIDLEHGHASQAVDIWNHVLVDDGVDLPPLFQARVFNYRARGLTQLGDYAGALRDTKRYVAWLEDERKTQSVNEVAVLRVRFETALKDDELARARAEAHAAELAISHQTFVRNLLVGSAVVMVAAGAFGAWLVRRRQLAVNGRRVAEERLAAIGRLTGGIAHDFNNLLTVIQQAVGLLLRRKSVAEDEAALDLVSQAREASQICVDITSQLLSFSRQQNLKPESVALDRYLPENLPLLERAVGANVGIRLELQAADRAAWVDERQLTAALLNLATNARDAMGGSGTLTLSLSDPIDGLIRLDVIDDGCGMTMEVLAHATDPFYSTKAVGSGSGLGLSMVQGFITQSGGELRIVSEPNLGTTVSLYLPPAPPLA